MMTDTIERFKLIDDGSGILEYVGKDRDVTIEVTICGGHPFKIPANKVNELLDKLRELEKEDDDKSNSKIKW